MKLSVWAPLAKAVEVDLAGKRLPLERGERGLWQVDVPVTSLVDGYRFSIDGGAPFPDPRSRWQPRGVHGPSHPIDEVALRRFHHAKFRPIPWREAIVYELHLGTFTPEGTYAAAQAKLPHLASLGVTHVELMPLATFPGRHGWGYDGVALYAPHPAYGTPEQLAAFVGACHGHGLAVLLDVVYNHFGPDGNHAPQFAPYLTDRWKTPWGAAVNYDGEYSDGVRNFIIENALMWLRDYGFDGLRLDAVHSIFDMSAMHVLEELAEAVTVLGGELGREFVLVAESDLNNPRFVLPPEQGGYGLRAHWCDDFHHALHAFLTGERDGYYADFGSLAQLATALHDGYVYQGQYSEFRKRRHGRAPRGIAPHQLVVCSQNHDQIGNRAAGERLNHLLAPHQLRAAAALTLLSPFTPLLFQGEEWAASTPFLYFTDHQDPRLARAVTEGRRKEFESFTWKVEVSDPQSAETFARSKLKWDELDEQSHAAMLAWYRRLISIRHEHLTRVRSSADVVTPTPPEVHFDEGARWLVWCHGDVFVACNFSEQEAPLTFPPGTWRVALAEPELPSAGAALPRHATIVFVRSPLATAASIT